MSLLLFLMIFERTKGDWCARIVQQCAHPLYPPLTNIQFHFNTRHASAPHELKTHLWPRPVWLLCTVHVSKPGATSTRDGARAPVVCYPPAIHNVPSLYKGTWIESRPGHRLHERCPNRCPPCCVIRPAATFVNIIYTINIAQSFRMVGTTRGVPENF